jgi:peptidyl-prolyl cis-trans isomerase SurA
MTEKLTRINLQGRFKTKGRFTTKPSIVATFVLSAAMASSSAVAQTQPPPQQRGYPAGGANFEPSSTLSLPALPASPPITPNGSVVEDAVARINDQIITRTEYEAAEQQLLEQARQDNLSQADLDDRVNNLLRDLIDEQLLLSKGKELGITGDAETIRELDDIRKKNNLPSMEALEKAAATQGVSFEDFKQHIRDQIIRQQVVRDQVGSHLNMTRAEEVAYYNAHAQEFAVPEQLHLSEILIPTPENATQAQIDAAQAKADGIAGKLRAGGNFAAIARTDSGGPTAAAGGDLGDFKRGSLGDVLEKATFSLPVGGTTDPIRTRQGYVILHVDSHQQAGVPPLSDVEPKVQEALYFQQLQPALRAYLTKARADAYMEIDTKDGFADTGAATKKANTQIAYTSYKAPPLKKKVKAKQRLEQEKANHAQAELAAARERVAEKEAVRAAKVDEKTGKPVEAVYKPKKIHREKIRYGEAPEKALPNGTAETAEGGSIGAPITGQAPGVAMAPNESITTITTGTGADEDTADPFASKTGVHQKVRFSDLETQAEVRSAKEHLTKAEAKAETRPLPTTSTENADEKLRAQPLGLNGDTVAKQKKPKHQKGELKERMTEKPAQPKETPNTVAPTVNPNLATPVPAPAPASNPSPSQQQ